MKKYIFLFAVMFLCGCASQNNTQIQEKTAVEPVTETTVETTTEKKKNFLVYSVTENKVELKLNKKVVQTIELDYSPIREYISADDFDFDGYTDIFIPSEHSGISGTYYRYNPETEQFEEWDELNEFGYKLTVTPDNTLTDTSYSEYSDYYTTYKWNNDILEPVTLLERYLTYSDIIEDFYEYQPDGSKILMERAYVNPKNNAQYKTLGRDEVIYFEVTENSVNAMRDGKVLQSFENNTIYNHSLSGERHIPPEKYLDTSDFDYDGYEDLFIPETADKGTYYRFNPDTEQFEDWDELNKIGSPMYIQNKNDRHLRQYNIQDSETFLYEWNGDKLLLSQREFTKDDGQSYVEYFDSDGNPVNRKKIVSDYYKSKASSVEHTDFDFDGYDDLYIPDSDRLHGTYYRYVPDMERFEEWEELNKIGKPLIPRPSVSLKTLLQKDDDGRTFIYKWKNDSIIMIERCETVYDEENNPIKIWYTIDENGNETLSDESGGD